MAITVSALALAPVKGLRLMPADELELARSGPLGDRAYVVVDEDRRLLATSRTPALLQVEPALDAATGQLSRRFAGGDTVAAVPEPGETVTVSLYDGRRVTGRLVRGPLGEAISDHLERPATLVALDPAQTGADDFPVTLMSIASLGALAEALDGRPPDARRFRMNITVEGAEPWEEHGWAGREVRVGEAALGVVDPVPRCVVTTRDPETGSGDVPTLRALAQLRGKDDVTFGVWCRVTRPGRVRRGDAVEPSG